MLDKRTSVAGDESDLRQQLSVAPHLSAYDELHTLPDRHDHRHHGVHRAGDGSLWLLPVDACDDYRAALLDDVPIMTIDFDNASAPEKPVRWEMKIMAVSVVLGILAVVQSFGLMYLGKTVFGLDLAQLQTMMFLQLVAGGHLMLFVTRSETEFWRPPYPPLVGSCQCCPGVIAVVWASNLIWMVVLDWAKLAVYRELRLRDEGRTPFLMRLKTPLYPGTSTGL